jgi:nucleotide-binding universal stress UspA family protein
VQAAEHAHTETTDRCVVIGYDGSDPARAALGHAISRAGANGKVIVVAAFALPPEWRGSPSYQRVLDEHESRGQSLLDDLEQDGTLAGIEHELELVAGRPAEAIARVATMRDADEIVVGSRGFGPVRAMLGSVSHELVHIADRPVTVLPDRFLETDRGSALRDSVPAPAP